MRIKSEVYSNSPLNEVVFEMKFMGEPAIECQRDKFFKRVRNKYPNVLVPGVKAEEFPALAPYRFENQDRSSGIMMAINRFAYYSRKYRGYKIFRKEAVWLMQVFGNVFKLNKLNRTGWRYINIIPFTREDGYLPLKRFFNVKLIMPKSVPDQYENLSIVFITKTNGGSITVKLESMMAADKSHEAFLLDFDYAKVKKLTFDKIGSYINESHRFTRALFEELITNSYRKYLRGETI